MKSIKIDNSFLSSCIKDTVAAINKELPKGNISAFAAASPKVRKILGELITQSIFDNLGGVEIIHVAPTVKNGEVTLNVEPEYTGEYIPEKISIDLPKPEFSSLKQEINKINTQTVQTQDLEQKAIEILDWGLQQFDMDRVVKDENGEEKIRCPINVVDEKLPYNAASSTLYENEWNYSFEVSSRFPLLPKGNEPSIAEGILYNIVLSSMFENVADNSVVVEYNISTGKVLYVYHYNSDDGERLYTIFELQGSKIIDTETGKNYDYVDAPWCQHAKASAKELLQKYVAESQPAEAQPATPPVTKTVESAPANQETSQEAPQAAESQSTEQAPQESAAQPETPVEATAEIKAEEQSTQQTENTQPAETAQNEQQPTEQQSTETQKQAEAEYNPLMDDGQPNANATQPDTNQANANQQGNQQQGEKPKHIKSAVSPNTPDHNEMNPNGPPGTGAVLPEVEVDAAAAKNPHVSNILKGLGVEPTVPKTTGEGTIKRMKETYGEGDMQGAQPLTGQQNLDGTVTVENANTAQNSAPAAGQ